MFQTYTPRLRTKKTLAFFVPLHHLSASVTPPTLRRMVGGPGVRGMVGGSGNSTQNSSLVESTTMSLSRSSRTQSRPLPATMALAVPFIIFHR